MTSTSSDKPGIARRMGVAGVVALTGILLLLIGVGMVAAESQLRVDAATDAVHLTFDQLDQLSEAGIDDIGQGSYRDWLITVGMTTGGPMQKLVLDISESDEGVMWSWAPENAPLVSSPGGWQPKPLAFVAFAGLALIIGSLFMAASRWRPRHPRPKLTDASRAGQTV